MIVTRKAAKKELVRRARAELAALRVRDPEAFAGAVKGAIIASLHDRQVDVVRLIEEGQRYIALCCSRRAGKTYLLAALIVLRLLDAGFNQAVFFAAPTLKKGKKLIWKEVEKLERRYVLGWKMTPIMGEIETPRGAMFLIVGLSHQGEEDVTRGYDIVMCLADEVQEYEHMLAPFLASTAPALTGRRGVFIASGTPGFACRGQWFDIATKGARGFVSRHWNIIDNTKNPRPGQEVIDEEMARDGYTVDHPYVQRELLGLWVEDFDHLVYEYVATKSAVRHLPPSYGLHWKHVIAVDYGYTDPCAWVVLAADPLSRDRYVVHAESHSRLIHDQAVEITRALVDRFATVTLVADPGGGGLPFYTAFNRRYAAETGARIKGAPKWAGSVAATVMSVNTELRTCRLKLLLPDAAALDAEISRLRWADDARAEVMSSAEYPDHCADALRYALAEMLGQAPKTAKVDAEEDAEERALRRRLDTRPQAQEERW